MSGWFVNYSEGDEHKAICIHCFDTFDKRESKREEFCSRYCAKTYERKIYGWVDDGSDHHV